MSVLLARAKSISGWMNPSDLTFLAEQAQRAQTLVEIGCWMGRSTRALADNKPQTATLHCIDTWRGSENEIVHRKMIADLGGEDPIFTIFRHNLFDCDNLVVHRGRSEDVRPELDPLCGRVDFLFIDGNHTFAGVETDIRLYKELVTPGGVIAGHDLDNNGVKWAVETHFGIAYQCVPGGRIWWTVTRT